MSVNVVVFFTSFFSFFFELVFSLSVAYKMPIISCMLESCKHMKSSQRPDHNDMHRLRRNKYCNNWWSERMQVSEKVALVRSLSHYLCVSNDDDICDKTTISWCKQATAKCCIVSPQNAEQSLFIKRLIVSFSIENVICATLRSLCVICVNPSTHFTHFTH